MTCRLIGLFALAVALAVGPVRAQDRIELIELRNRPAAEVATIVRPLLSPEDALTVDGNVLILRAAPARIAEVRRVVEQIDRAPRNLMVSVRRATAAEAERLELEGRARASGGDSTLTIGDAGSDGVSVSTERRYSTRRESDVQRLRVLEGNRALIQVGESVPYPQASIVVSPWGSAVSGGIEYKDIGTGFLVLPRLNGETVTLEVEQIAERRRGSDGAITRQGSNTVVSGRVGDWIEISGTARTGDERSSRVLSTRRDRAGDAFSILVRVEPVD